MIVYFFVFDNHIVHKHSASNFRSRTFLFLFEAVLLHIYNIHLCSSDFLEYQIHTFQLARVITDADIPFSGCLPSTICPTTSPTDDCDTTFLSDTNLLKLQNLSQIPTALNCGTGISVGPGLFDAFPILLLLSC